MTSHTYFLEAKWIISAYCVDSAGNGSCHNTALSNESDISNTFFLWPDYFDKTDTRPGGRPIQIK